MENGSTASGTTHQGQSSLTGKVQPVGGEMVLVSAQGQGGAAPSIEAKQGSIAIAIDHAL
jgi:hypothetical protein